MCVEDMERVVKPVRVRVEFVLLAHIVEELDGINLKRLERSNMVGVEGEDEK